MARVVRRWLVGFVVMSTLVACGTVDPGDEQPVSPAPTLPEGAIDAVTDTATSEVAAAVTAAVDPTTTVAQTTTDFPTTVPTTSLVASTLLPEFVDLRPDGIGESTFGQDAELAITWLTDRLGPPNEDSGWVVAVSSPFGVCPGTDVRGLRWGPLQVLFGDIGTSTRQVFTWVYAVSLLPAGEPQGEAAGLQTTEGIGLGSSIADLTAAYPQLSVSTDIYGPTFTTGGLAGYSGTISSEGIDGFVTSLVGGTYCGE